MNFQEQKVFFLNYNFTFLSPVEYVNETSRVLLFIVSLVEMLTIITVRMMTMMKSGREE